MASQRPDIREYQPRTLTRRVSDGDFQNEESYYGPDFRNVERGLSSSISVPHRPKTPDQHEKNPDPYTPDVDKDYNFYKSCEEVAGALNREFRDCGVNVNDTPQNAEDAERYRQAKELKDRHLRAVNEHAQSRSAFMEKYPYAYEASEVDGHLIAVMQRRREARKARRIENLIKKRLESYDEISRGEPPSDS